MSSIRNSFKINLAVGISMQVQPVRERDDITAFQLFVEGKYHGEIYPDTENAFVEWRSHDKIDPVLITAIGRAIDDYYS